jgi:hypothetical protein
MGKADNPWFAGEGEGEFNLGQAFIQKRRGEERRGEERRGGEGRGGEGRGGGMEAMGIGIVEL